MTPDRQDDGQDWRPSATRDALVLRADLLARIRGYFADNGVLEVDTPVLSVAATPDPSIQSLQTCWHGAAMTGGLELYLHSSPEFPMKRLLAAGSGDIYQLCKVFRDNERGSRHSPEFTMLEWYRIGYDHLDLMDDVERLLATVLAGIRPPASVDHWTYRELFREFTGLDPFSAGPPDFTALLARHGIEVPAAMLQASPDSWLDLVLSCVIEPRMGEGLLFVTDFPASQASLARLRSGNPAVASRFEAWLDGVEIANGFHELADADEQRHRFEQDNARRRQAGLDSVPVDERLLAAIRSGLPDCAGVALGLDRLLMHAAGADDLDAVQAFPVETA